MFRLYRAWPESLNIGMLARLKSGTVGGASFEPGPSTPTRWLLVAISDSAAGTASAGSPRLSTALHDACLWLRIPPAATIAWVAGAQPAICSGPKLASGPLKLWKAAKLSGLLLVSAAVDELPDPDELAPEELALDELPHALMATAAAATAQSAKTFFIQRTSDDQYLARVIGCHRADPLAGGGFPRCRGASGDLPGRLTEIKHMPCVAGADGGQRRLIGLSRVEGLEAS